MSESTKNAKRMRFAIYARYSSEMQNEISLDDQEAVCRKAIAERGGVVVVVYKDAAKTGWSLERDGFNAMRRAAQLGKFDAVMMWKFDRLARDHNHAVMIKSLVRHEYGLKLFCVEGFSEDDNDDPYTSMMEQMIAVFSAFYSKNLSTETKRAKYQRAVRGEFNGSIPPLGYLLMLKKDATEEMRPGLYVDPETAPIVVEAFIRYVTGQYSDADIAAWMNEQPAIQKLREGKQPINKEMVRDMLQNRVYTGRVPYAETEYNGTLGESKKSSRGRKIWSEGLHEAIISDELFDRAHEVRAGLARNRRTARSMRTYLLNDRVYCAQCVIEKPVGLDDDNYGRMRPMWDNRTGYSYYRCLARERGYHACEQAYVRAEEIDGQVVAVLSRLEIPQDFQQRVEQAVTSRIENEAALKRMAELKEIIERVDIRWEHGFIDKESYFEKRKELEREIDALRPIDYDDLLEAADLIRNFKVYWDQCESLENPEEARQLYN